MLSLPRLNDVHILHFEPATLGGRRCACSFGVRYRAIIWPHPCIIAWPLTTDRCYVLVTGIADPLGPLAVAGAMAGATAVHRKQGPLSQNGGFELPLTNLALAVGSEPLLREPLPS
jgi:hypothetical protein